MGKIEKTIISDFWGPPSNDGKEYHKILSGKVSEESDKFFVVIECCEHNQSENMDF